jgi:phage shock protein PspC (stress-responsive transcriptional regulator)
MNRTITITISGIIFHIEEYAYEILREYLDNLKHHFSKTEGGDEIINDIESRIAEIFQSKISDKKQVIILEEVNEVIEILGKPENFDNAGDEKNAGSDNWNKSGEHFKSKRLFRDVDNKVLGGVCSGLGHYFSLDPVWFRLAFVLALIFFGSGVLVYLVLWIVMPKAMTTAEKLQMRGEKLNISDIEKNIKEEIEELKQRFHNFKKDAKYTSKEEFGKFKKNMHNIKNDAKDYYNKDYSNSFFQNIIHAFVTIIKYIVKAFIIFLGIIILAISTALIIALIISLSGSSHHIIFSNEAFSYFSIPAIAEFIFNTNQQAAFAIIGICLLIGIPLLMMIYTGVKLVFGINRKIKVISYSSLILWLSGLFICGYLAFEISQQFTERSNIRINISLKQPADSTLYLLLSEKSINDYDFESPDHKIIFNNCFFTSDDEMGYRCGAPKMKIVKSSSDLFELQIIKSAYGSSTKNAGLISEKIIYNLKQKDSLLFFDNFFTIEKGGKWRNQDVKIILKVPSGKMIKINDDIKNMLCDEESDDVLCSETENKKFIMTENGLTPNVIKN